jgi:ATP-binding cassette, subfamily B, bacterial
MMGSGPVMIRGVGNDSSITRQRIKRGTVRRIFPYARRYRWRLALLLFLTAIDACITAATPLLLKIIINSGIIRRDMAIVVVIAVVVAGLALVDSVTVYVQSWYSAQIGEGLVYDLRTQVFSHVQRQPIAFFTRAQTGSLVSRLNTDVVTAQQSIISLLSTSMSSLLSVALILAAMFYLSWQITVVAIVLIPVFLLPGRLVGSRLQRLTRESMQLNAEMGSLMNERFNVAGAILAKLFGRPESEDAMFARRAARVRDIGVLTSVFSKLFFISVTFLAALTTALVYGLGGALVIRGAFQIGTLVALATLLTRLYGPINQLSNLQVSVLTALVSFDRVFEVLDLKPLVAEQPGAHSLPATSSSGNGAAAGNGTAPEIEFDKVSFRYPAASEVSLASLESIALPAPERGGNTDVLREISFSAPAGKLTALVGPSGAGKTTITTLVPRLYDPISGTVRIGGHDIRELTMESLRDTVGVVTQDAHMFHDTIRGNLAYARPDAIEQDLIEACRAAQIWDLISSLPDGLDTVVGDRGFRLSGGEKQRVAIARLLLKAPSIVVLDEATAHLDSESEAAVQRALKTALTGRTSLVIAHRLSTIREADQILVINNGQISERGTHEELLLAGGLYAELYRTQFARQSKAEVREETIEERIRREGLPAMPPPPPPGMGGLAPHGGGPIRLMRGGQPVEGP